MSLIDKTKRYVPRSFKTRPAGWILGTAGSMALVFGLWHVSFWPCGLGGALLMLAAWCANLPAQVRAQRRKKADRQAVPASTAAAVPVAPPPRRPGTAGDELVEDMLGSGRYALLLRRQVIEHLNAQQLQRTVVDLQDHMALVPKGQVVLGITEENVRADDEDGEPHGRGRIVDVDPVFLDRYPITNGQFQRFVNDGGYEEMAIWEEQVLPALLDFVDATGHPGPRFWQHGRFPAGQEDHPVVGISWYEACAYARWVGKRLPSDAEWCKAASWPVNVSPGNWLQRRFPWGNAFETHRANLWGSGHRTTLPVDQCADGMSVGGVHQMVGNVWEWTSGAYGRADDTTLSLPVPMKSIRGGAFDTYFENQATCQFQSGENPLNRKHNIGFRLALGACDLAPQAANLLLAGVTSPPEPELAEEVTV